MPLKHESFLFCSSACFYLNQSFVYGLAVSAMKITYFMAYPARSKRILKAVPLTGTSVYYSMHWLWLHAFRSLLQCCESSLQILDRKNDEIELLKSLHKSKQNEAEETIRKLEKKGDFFFFLYGWFLFYLFIFAWWFLYCILFVTVSLCVPSRYKHTFPLRLQVLPLFFL